MAKYNILETETKAFAGTFIGSRLIGPYPSKKAAMDDLPRVKEERQSRPYSRSSCFSYEVQFAKKVITNKDKNPVL